MTTKEFCQKAIEGGFRVAGYEDAEVTSNGLRISYCDYIDKATILLDPLAWQAVGKVEGWDENIPQVSDKELSLSEIVIKYKKMPEYAYNMHRMVDYLCDGGTIESFLETL